MNIVYLCKYIYNSISFGLCLSIMIIMVYNDMHNTAGIIDLLLCTNPLISLVRQDSFSECYFNLI